MRGRPQQTLPGLIADWRALVLLPGSIWLPVVAMSIIAICAVLFNEASVKRIRADSEQMTALLNMRKNVFAMRTAMVDAETGQRGYLLTRDLDYLQPYHTATNELSQVTTALMVASADDPALLAHVKKLDELRSQKLAELSATITMVEQGVPGDALEVMHSGKGRVVMDAFRAESAAVLHQLELRAVQLRSSSLRDLQWSRAAFATLGLLTLALLVVAFRLLARDFWTLQSSHQEAMTEQQRLEQVVKDRTAELSDLMTYLQMVTEQEKADLARNLHDELGGLLTAAKMDLAWLQGRASAVEPQVRSKLEALANGIDEAMDVKRRVVENLRPALLEHFGLPTALQAHFADTCAKAGMKCRAKVPESSEHISRDMAIALFRVAQESLTNIIRHAAAQNVDIALEIKKHEIRLRIADDGVGMGQLTLNATASHGLAGMRHRIESLHGRFKIGPNQPRGTRIDVVVPRLLKSAANVSSATRLDAGV